MIMSEPGHLQQIYTTAWKTIQGPIHELVRFWITKMNADHLTLLEIAFLHSVHTRKSSERVICKTLGCE